MINKISTIIMTHDKKDTIIALIEKINEIIEQVNKPHYTPCYQCSINNEKFKPKEKPMETRVIFESEEEAVNVMNTVVIRAMQWQLNKEETLKSWKKLGYIRKNPVEEAEEMYQSSYRFTNVDKDKLIEKQHEALQYLKSENERLKK